MNNNVFYFVALPPHYFKIIIIHEIIHEIFPIYLLFQQKKYVKSK